MWVKSESLGMGQGTHFDCPGQVKMRIALRMGAAESSCLEPPVVNSGILAQDKSFGCGLIHSVLLIRPGEAAQLR